MDAVDNRMVRYWWIVALAALVAGAVTTAAAQGFPIIELEFAWTAESADAVLAGADLDAVTATILWDYLFLVLYTAALYLGSLWASGVVRGDRLANAGRYVAYGALLAGAFDAVENLAMLGYLNDWLGFTGWPLVAGLMAAPKFLLAAISIIYVLIGVVSAVTGRITTGR